MWSRDSYVAAAETSWMLRERWINSVGQLSKQHCGKKLCDSANSGFSSGPSDKEKTKAVVSSLLHNWRHKFLQGVSTQVLIATNIQELFKYELLDR